MLQSVRKHPGMLQSAGKHARILQSVRKHPGILQVNTREYDNQDGSLWQWVTSLCVGESFSSIWTIVSKSKEFSKPWIYKKLTKRSEWQYHILNLSNIV